MVSEHRGESTNGTLWNCAVDSGSAHGTALSQYYEDACRWSKIMEFQDNCNFLAKYAMIDDTGNDAMYAMIDDTGNDDEALERSECCKMCCKFGCMQYNTSWCHIVHG